jgi:hypothetical protein
MYGVKEWKGSQLKLTYGGNDKDKKDPAKDIARGERKTKKEKNKKE